MPLCWYLLKYFKLLVMQKFLFKYFCWGCLDRVEAFLWKKKLIIILVLVDSLKLTVRAKISYISAESVMKTRRQTRDFGQDLSNIVPDRPRDKKKVPPSSENTLQQSMVLPPRETDFRKKTAPINKREASWNAVDDY